MGLELHWHADSAGRSEIFCLSAADALNWMTPEFLGVHSSYCLGGKIFHPLSTSHGRNSQNQGGEESRHRHTPGLPLLGAGWAGVPALLFQQGSFPTREQQAEVAPSVVPEAHKDGEVTLTN